MNKILITLLLFLLSSCSTINNKSFDIKPKGELLAYLQITNPTYYNKEGYYFYKENRKDQNPTLYVYEYRNGTMVSMHATEFFNDINSIGLEPFDYEKEIELAKEKSDFEWITLDGYELEIMINTNQGKFLIKTSNPGADLRECAKYSENLQKLVKVIKHLQLYYGESVINIL